MEYRKVLALAVRFSNAQAGGDVLLDDFLASEGIPEGERYEAACHIAHFLARYTYYVGEITEAVTKMTV